MNIFFITSSMNMGGAERAAATLCNAWAAAENQVTLVPTFSQASIPFYELSKDIELIYLNSLVPLEKKNFLNYAKRLLALRHLIQQKKPDVIISFLSNVNVATIFATRFLKIPVICCERRNPQDSIGFFWEWMCRKVYPFTDILLVQTTAAIEATKKIHPKVKQIYSIANPVSNDILNIKKIEVTRSRKILLSVSRLVKVKQIDQMILVFNKLANLHHDWDLHIYGEGPLQHELVLMIKSLNLEDRVFLKGAISNPWQTLANEADIFLMCSQHEGFPNALLEAMAVGLPSITYDFPYGAQEMSKNGRYAVLVPLNDLRLFEAKLNELMSNQLLRMKLSDQSQQYIANHYNIDTILSFWNALFLKLGISIDS